MDREIGVLGQTLGFLQSKLHWICCFALIVGCQNAPEFTKIPTGEEIPTVLSTIAPIEVLVSAIGGSRIRSDCLIAGELDPHSYQLVKGDREKFRRAHLVFYNGLGLEHGPSLATSLTNCPQAISLGNWLETGHLHEILRSGNSPDPHLWMDVQLWGQFLPCVCHHLAKLAPKFADEFYQRAASLQAEFGQTHRQIRQLLHQVPPNRRYLVTTHDAFSYFARAYLSEDSELASGDWRRRVMAPEGLAPESQISLQQMQRTLQYLIDHKVAVVFAESNINFHSLRKIVEAARAQNVPIVLAEKKLYGDAMPPYQMGPLGYRAYLGMLVSNAQVICQSLRAKSDEGL